MMQEKFSTEIAEKAKDIITNLQGLHHVSMANYDTRLKTLEIFVALELRFQNFCSANGCKQKFAWPNYFEGLLTNEYPNLSWSHSNLRKMKMIAGDEIKKNAYLAGITLTSEGKSRTELQKFQSAVKSLNDVLPLLTDVVTLGLTESGLLEIIPIKSEVQKLEESLSDAEKEVALRNYILFKKQSIGKDLLPLEAGLQ